MVQDFRAGDAGNDSARGHACNIFEHVWALYGQFLAIPGATWPWVSLIGSYRFHVHLRMGQQPFRGWFRLTPVAWPLAQVWIQITLSRWAHGSPSPWLEKWCQCLFQVANLSLNMWTFSLRWVEITSTDVDYLKKLFNLLVSLRTWHYLGLAGKIWRVLQLNAWQTKKAT